MCRCLNLLTSPFGMLFCVVVAAAGAALTAISIMANTGALGFSTKDLHALSSTFFWIVLGVGCLLALMSTIGVVGLATKKRRFMCPAMLLLVLTTLGTATLFVVTLRRSGPIEKFVGRPIEHGLAIAERAVLEDIATLVTEAGCNDDGSKCEGALVGTMLRAWGPHAEERASFKVCMKSAARHRELANKYQFCVVGAPIAVAMNAVLQKAFWVTLCALIAQLVVFCAIVFSWCTRPKETRELLQPVIHQVQVVRNYVLPTRIEQRQPLHELAVGEQPDAVWVHGPVATV